MDVLPVVRYFLLSEDIATNPIDPKKVTVIDLLTTMRSKEDPAYPVLIPVICCTAWLTDGRKPGEAQIVCVEDETAEKVFASRPHVVELSEDPLEVSVVAIRIGDCGFPNPGLFTFEFHWNGKKIAECPLRMR
jgi:hypothetical protein